MGFLRIRKRLKVLRIRKRLKVVTSFIDLLYILVWFAEEILTVDTSLLRSLDLRSPYSLRANAFSFLL